MASGRTRLRVLGTLVPPLAILAAGPASFPVPALEAACATPAGPSGAGEGRAWSPLARVERGLQPLVALAVADLAARLSVDAAAIEVLSAEAVVWPDAGLGCPAPGREYPQVPREGYRIRLRAAERVYAYHGGDGRGPFFCERP